MIPVVKVIESAQAMGDGSGSNKDKTAEQFQRQDSGFVSASQTPVTPSQYDIHGQPTISNHLPTIHEGMNGAPRLLQEVSLYVVCVRLNGCLRCFDHTIIHFKYLFMI